MAQLDPLRDTVAAVDLLGRPVACARFMAGREYAAIAGVRWCGRPRRMADVEALDRGRHHGAALVHGERRPVPGHGRQGDGSSARCPSAGRARAALASLYLALMASACLDLLRSRGQVIIDGAFADDPLFAGLLAALRPGQPVAVSSERQGAALGAALLWGWPERRRSGCGKLQRYLE